MACLWVVLSTGCLIIVPSLESRLRGSDRLEAILDGGENGEQCMGAVS